MNLTGREQAERIEVLRTGPASSTCSARSRSTDACCCPTKTSPASPDVAILSYGCWKRSFSGDPRIVGQKHHR